MNSMITNSLSVVDTIEEKLIGVEKKEEEGATIEEEIEKTDDVSV